MWVSGARASNPAAGAVLCDTGPIQYGGTLMLRLIIKSPTGCETILEHRNAANTTTRQGQGLSVVAGLLPTPTFGPIHVQPGERVRLIVRNAVVTPAEDDVQASMFWWWGTQ